jgi:GH15 family glucan-1,4-alpha-glucosidase
MEVSMPVRIEQERYKTPLCPYLLVGNRRILVHLDAYCVPQSLQWPRPGSPDRLAWRDPFDEWPYWEEMDRESIRARMPYFEYADGSRDYLHDASSVEAGYVEDTNVLEGAYQLPGGARVEITTFVPPSMDVWVRRFKVHGEGKLVLQSEFFEKAVKGHPGAHMGNINFRGAFDAAPRGAYVIMSTLPLAQKQSRVEVPVSGETSWAVFMSIADDLKGAVAQGEEALRKGYESLAKEAISADRAWISRAGEPVARHPFILKNYKRWLLANALLTAHDGAMLAGPRPFWSFAWPRDCSLGAAAFAAAGFSEEGQRIIGWHLGNTPDSGVHDSRYFTDRAPMLLDNRPRQGDNPGFLSWAASFVCRHGWDKAWAEGIKEKLYVLADHLVQDRDPETLLPLPEADYWETKIAESLSIAVSAIGGLKGAAYIAERLGDSGRAERYLARAEEIKSGAEEHLWNKDEHYFMLSVKPADTSSDVALCWGIYPFCALSGSDEKAREGLARVVRDRWSREAGGVLCGPGTPLESYWMYHTGILLMGVAGIGDKEMETEILVSLEKNVSPQGLIPEQVSRAGGRLWGCAPLPAGHANLLIYAYKQP